MITVRPGLGGGTSLSMQRRAHDARFATRYFVGHGIDVGGGDDSLANFVELFPLIKSINNYDKNQGDAQLLAHEPDDKYDFVYCVRPGQLVITPSGRVKIETVRVGDVVLGRSGFVYVKAICRYPFRGRLYRLETSEGVAEVTGNHPIATPCGWFNADHLRHADKVFGVSSKIESPQFINCGNVLRTERSRAPLGSDWRRNVAIPNASKTEGKYNFSLSSFASQVWYEFFQKLNRCLVAASYDKDMTFFRSAISTFISSTISMINFSPSQNIRTTGKNVVVAVSNSDLWLQTLPCAYTNTNAAFPINNPSQICPLSIQNLRHVNSFNYAGDIINLETTDGTFILENILTHNSSHCLEHMLDPYEALKNWIRVCRPSGYLVISVPDEDLYEQGVWPSTFNPDHKHAFTICKKAFGTSWLSTSVQIDLFDLISSMIEIQGCQIKPLSIQTIDHAYRYNLPRFDQTSTPLCECSIEFILKKL